MRSIDIQVSSAPVSQQASGVARSEIKELIRRELLGMDFFLMGEIELNIKWIVHDRIRYETDTTPDVDNIIKPIIDGLSGENGIIIDDCQIQHLSCGWTHTNEEDQSFQIEIKYMTDDIMSSREILFIQFENGLCFPVRKDISKDYLPEMVAHLVKRFEWRQERMNRTNDYGSIAV